MMKKIFWEDPYATTHATVVETVQGQEVTVRSTIFFAFAGGQESDVGTIHGNQVLQARKEGLEIIYTLPEDHGLQPGQPVNVVIDWQRRHRLMRLHFAAELVLELVSRALPMAGKIGAHISQDKARIDFAWPQSITPVLSGVEAEANRIISSNLPIRCAFEDEANERRYWEIEGFSRVPCGGTHVRSTGEIGSIRLKRDNIGKGKERIEIRLS